MKVSRMERKRISGETHALYPKTEVFTNVWCDGHLHVEDVLMCHIFKPELGMESPCEFILIGTNRLGPCTCVPSEERPLAPVVQLADYRK